MSYQSNFLTARIIQELVYYSVRPCSYILRHNQPLAIHSAGCFLIKWFKWDSFPDPIKDTSPQKNMWPQHQQIP
jgi:hypothetical protein